MRRFFLGALGEDSKIRHFFNFIYNTLSEINQLWIVSRISRGTENFGSVRLIVHQKIDAWTDRQAGPLT